MAKQSTEKDKSSGLCIRDHKITISQFIELKGGIKDLDRVALQKVYKKEIKTGEEWMSELKKLTIIKEIDEDFLDREIG